MDALWTTESIVNALPQATISGTFAISGISIDSRTLQVGDLFIAIDGEHVDGHNYVEKAFQAGAAAALVHKDINQSDNYPIIQCDDTFQALNDLASHARKRCKGTFFGLTGSVGKTTTKAMLEHVLKAYGEAYATVGNLNNHYGVPLTLARMPSTSMYSVIEMGMNHAHEISPLSKLTRPHIAIITAIDAVHIGNFDSIEGIAHAKSEIFDGVEEDATAILPFDTPHLPILKKAAEDAGVKKIVTFGKQDGADIQLLDYDQKAGKAEITISFHGKHIPVQLGLVGEHMALNALSVLAATDAAGLDINKAITQLSQFGALAGRGKKHEIHLNNKTFTLIDDSYNASPASMRAAITVLGNAKGRKVAILGDMLELGNNAIKLHTDLADDLEKAGIDLVCACGKYMRHLHATLPHTMQGLCADNPELLYDQLNTVINDSDTILVKGSHGSNIYRVVEQILKQNTPR